MLKFNQIFGNSKKCKVIGMVHVNALPGTPNYNGDFQQAIEKVKYETNIYKKCKVDALLLENMNDVPYVQQNKHINSEIVACMTRLCHEMKSLVSNSIPCGVQILACGNKQALAVAKATNLQFIRAEGFVFSHIADEGFTDANAGDLLRYRHQIDANNVLVFTDLKKKHSSHSITNDVSLLETAHAAEFFLTDGIILTATGQAVNSNDLDEIHNKVSSPIIIGSGVTTENILSYFHKSDACIIGSYFKKEGNWKNDLCEKRINTFMNKINDLRT